MDKEKAVQKMTEVMAKFVGYTGKVLPDDVTAKLLELSERETQPLAKEIYKTMFENQRLAKELDRPSCQDTGVIQFFVRCGANFPLIGEETAGSSGSLAFLQRGKSLLTEHRPTFLNEGTLTDTIDLPRDRTLESSACLFGEGRDGSFALMCSLEVANDRPCQGVRRELL